jgi:hypothetical protein
MNSAGRYPVSILGADLQNCEVAPDLCLKVLVIQGSEEFQIIACFLRGIFVYSMQYKDVENRAECVYVIIHLTRYQM